MESLLHKEESSLILLAKKLICIGEKSVPHTACLSSEVNKYTAELSFIFQGLKCQQKFAQSCLQGGELSAEIDDVSSRLA